MILDRLNVKFNNTGIGLHTMCRETCDLYCDDNLLIQIFIPKGVLTGQVTPGEFKKLVADNLSYVREFSKEDLPEVTEFVFNKIYETMPITNNYNEFMENIVIEAL